MNTVFTIITTAIVAGVIIMLISMTIADSIRNNRREKEYTKRREMEIFYNSLLPNAITFSDMRGFIRSEYAFGRFYVHYECINEDCEHFSKTISFNDDGSIRENYSRLGCKHGFENDMHAAIFNIMKAKVKSLIISLNNNDTI